MLVLAVGNIWISLCTFGTYFFGNGKPLMILPKGETLNSGFVVFI